MRSSRKTSLFRLGRTVFWSRTRRAANAQAYIEPVAVGDALPDMPLFLTNDLHVMVPLEPAYQASWDASPEELRIAVETGVLPEPEGE